MKLVAKLQDEYGRLLTTITAENRDFAPAIVKWNGSYFLRHDSIECGNEMTVAYRHSEFEDFSSQETHQ